MALDLVINVRFNMPPGGGITLPGAAPGGMLQFGKGAGTLAQQIQRQMGGGGRGAATGGQIGEILAGASDEFRRLNPQLNQLLAGTSPIIGAAIKLEQKQIRDSERLEQFYQRSQRSARAMGVRFGLLFGVSSGLYDLTGGAISKFGPLSSMLGMGLSTLPMKFLESGAGLAGGLGVMGALLVGGEVSKNMRAANAFKTTTFGLPLDFMSGGGAVRGAIPGLNALGGSFSTSNNESAARIAGFLKIAGRGGMGGRAAVGLGSALDYAFTEKGTWGWTNRLSGEEIYKTLAEAAGGMSEGERNRNIKRIAARAAAARKTVTRPGYLSMAEQGSVWIPGETSFQPDPEAGERIIELGRRRLIRRDRNRTILNARLESEATMAAAGREGALRTIGDTAQNEQQRATLLLQTDLKRLDIRQRIAGTDKQRHDLEIDGINRTEKADLHSLQIQSNKLTSTYWTAGAEKTAAQKAFDEAQSRFIGKGGRPDEFLGSPEAKRLEKAKLESAEAARAKKVFDDARPDMESAIRGGAAAGRYGADVGLASSRRDLAFGKLDFETSLTNAQMEVMMQLSTSQFGLGTTEKAGRRVAGLRGISRAAFGEEGRQLGFAARAGIGDREKESFKQKAAEARFRGEGAEGEAGIASDEFFYNFGDTDANRKKQYEAKDAVDRQIAYGKMRYNNLGTVNGLRVGREFVGDYQAKAAYDRNVPTPGGSAGMDKKPADLKKLVEGVDDATRALAQFAAGLRGDGPYHALPGAGGNDPYDAPVAGNGL